jgi:deoxyribodipyrimidine photolyase-related protein
MKNFYEWQRKRLNILIDDNNKPVGGSWSYDTENRKKIPKSISLPEIPKKAETQNVLEAKKYIEENFPNNYGDDSFFFYPTTHTEAENWLDDFLKNKLELFGPYEDAMVSENNILFHSLLSPILNIGLLTPKYVIDRTIKYTEEKETFHLASLEGFIRQVIGWREYIRAIYVIEGRKIRSGNYFKASKDLPKSFWTGNTGIYPVDQAIKNILKTAYSHHIERLMVMGNFMNLCGFKPDQIYRWFMEMYIDSYDWVMVPNVYSMALYADGGIITTKPYISGSNYILKMSNYKKEKWAEKWDTLFWNFVGKHYEDLKTEGRLGFIGILYQKMPEDKKENYREEAKKILEKLV